MLAWLGQTEFHTKPTESLGSAASPALKQIGSSSPCHDHIVIEGLEWERRILEARLAIRSIGLLFS